MWMRATWNQNNIYHILTLFVRLMSFFESFFYEFVVFSSLPLWLNTKSKSTHIYLVGFSVTVGFSIFPWQIPHGCWLSSHLPNSMDGYHFDDDIASEASATWPTILNEKNWILAAQFLKRNCLTVYLKLHPDEISECLCCSFNVIRNHTLNKTCPSNSTRIGMEQRHRVKMTPQLMFCAFFVLV